MDSNDLFSFLNEAPPTDFTQDADGDTQMHSASKKRKVTTPDAAEVNGTSADSPSNEAGPSEPKKPRLASPNPIVVDEVEIEAKREVAASAGLTGAVEAGSRLELRHQVSALSRPVERASRRPPNEASVLTMFAGTAPSRGAPGIPVHTNRESCPSRKTRTRIQVRFGPLPASVGACHTAERECARVRAHQCGKDCRGRVRHCSVSTAEAASDLHESNQGQ